jgi:hypothetical protein
MQIIERTIAAHRALVQSARDLIVSAGNTIKRNGKASEIAVTATAEMQSSVKQICEQMNREQDALAAAVVAVHPDTLSYDQRTYNLARVSQMLAQCTLWVEIIKDFGAGQWGVFPKLGTFGAQNGKRLAPLLDVETVIATYKRIPAEDPALRLEFEAAVNLIPIVADAAEWREALRGAHKTLQAVTRWREALSEIQAALLADAENVAPGMQMTLSELHFDALAREAIGPLEVAQDSAEPVIAAEADDEVDFELPEPFVSTARVTHIPAKSSEEKMRQLRRPREPQVMRSGTAKPGEAVKIS